MSNLKSKYHGTKGLSNLGPRIWNLFQIDWKKHTSISWRLCLIMPYYSKYCPCRLCKIIYQMLALFNLLGLHLLLKHIQKHSTKKYFMCRVILWWCTSSLLDNTLTWLSSGAFSFCFWSAISIGRSIRTFFTYYRFIYVYVDSFNISFHVF